MDDKKGYEKGYMLSVPSGIIVIDKPEGKSSTWVDNLIKKKLKTKVGHIGTIDPFASGILPVAVGKATKFIPYIIDRDREYIAEILLGKETDTDDITGKEIYSFSEVWKLDIKKVIEVIKSFEGVIEQVPPFYSAKRYMGKRLYEWAREGRYIELPPVRVTIYSIELLDIKLPVIKVKITSSSGMYVRALARDIGEKITVDGKKVGATLRYLRRTRCSIFTEGDSIPVQLIKELPPDQLIRYIRPVRPDMLDMRKIIVRGQDIERIKNAAPPRFKVQGIEGEKVALCTEDEKIIAVGEIRKKTVIVRRVIE